MKQNAISEVSTKDFRKIITRWDQIRVDGKYIFVRNYASGTFPYLQLWYVKIVEVSWDGGLDEISGSTSNPR